MVAARKTMVIVAFLAAGPASAVGQQLALKARPAPVSLLCEDTGPAGRPVAGDADEAERLVNAATQAMILGDMDVAVDFLDQALQADPSAAEAAYVRGRIATTTESAAAAAPWFCRYLQLAPEGASAEEARRRLRQAVEEGAGAALLSSFSGAVARFDAGDAASSEQLFTAILAQRQVAEALYNRGLVRLTLDRPAEARRDLQRYLDLRPDDPDRASVEEALAVLGRERSVPSAPAAFLLGAVVPGGGQYLTGRAGYGVLVTGLVAGAAATGYLYEETTILCRAPAADGSCPPDAIAGEETERPLLVPALGVGAGIMLVAAIEAALHARGQAALLSVSLDRAGASRLELAPPPTALGGTIDIHWLRFRH